MSEAAEESVCRKEKRKAAKKEKRKQKRREVAEKAREEELAMLHDPDLQLRIELEQRIEQDLLQKARTEFEERERVFREQLAKRKEEQHQNQQDGHENDEDDDSEYVVEEGPPEIIWKGNEIILKKKKVRVNKKDQLSAVEVLLQDPNRPTSNPLPPQSHAFSEFKTGSMVSAQQLLDDVAHQVPNFGTEQDKDHCPFHLKTGACRFGSRCSRVHFYPHRSCTLLIKNMYNGPGLAWEQDEGLECHTKEIREYYQTDEEVERCYEEFYEDVHTEFLKFGVIINFKVCRNSSPHLRGNVYVQYKSLDSAMFANQSINGRYFAGKQVTCEFINVSKWKIAICGEFMKSKLKTCSRGTACNFIHCFRNPGGDYEWADWDKPPPRYWIRKMDALFGYTDESAYERQVEDENMVPLWDTDRYHSKRSHSKEEAESPNRSSRSHYQEQNAHDTQRSSRSRRNSNKDRNWRDFHNDKYDGEEIRGMDHPHGIDKFCASESDKYWSDRDADVNWHDDHTGRRLRSPEGKRKSRDHEEGHKNGRHGGYSRKRSREVDDHKESKISVRHSKSSKEQSSKERGKDVHYSGRNSKHHNGKSVSIDDRWDGGS